MKKTTKRISLALAVVMLGALLAGCTNTGGTPTTAATTPPTTAPPAAGGTTTPADDGQADAFPGYPLDGTTTISWYVGTGPTLHQAYTKWEDSPFHSGLNEMTGVNIDWSFPTTGTDANQAFNLLMAGKTLPDIVYFGQPLLRDAERYIDEGVTRDLSEYIAEYSPAYYNYLQSNPSYDKAMKTDLGRYYGYGFFREAGGWNDTYQGPLIRQDWLDALNLEAPVTISDWDTVLAAFKENYNAIFSAPWSRFRSQGIPGAFGAYGGSDYKLYVDDNNKIQLAQVQPEWRDYVAKLNEWWLAGYIDQDLFTIVDADVRTKALNGVIGVAYSSMGQLSNWILDANNAGNGANWVGFQYPTADDGSISTVFGGYGIGANVSVITTSCPDEKLEVAMRLLDYAYTEEGNLYWNFGKQGVSWDYDANGQPAYLDIVTKDPDGLNDAIAKFGGSTWSGSCIQATLLLYLKNTEQAIAANDLWFYPNEAVSAKDKVPGSLTFTVDESNKLDEIRSAIDTYCTENFALFVTGQQPISAYDEFVNQLNTTLRLPELLEVYQAAYDRYLAR